MASVESITPDPSGPYLVQAGSFGDPENADIEASRLQNLGWDARVKVTNMADDTIIYRVRVGYFPDRQIAETFIKQHAQDLKGAIPVHR